MDKISKNRHEVQSFTILRLIVFMLFFLSACSLSPQGVIESNSQATPEPTYTLSPFAIRNTSTSPPPADDTRPTETAATQTAESDPSLFRVEVDVNQDVHEISQLIYGVSLASQEYLDALRPTLNSWGGNPSTRYNWKVGNAWNAGSDWFYMNGNYGVTSGSAGDNFMREAEEAGVEVRLAVPSLGWVAKDDDNAHCSFPLPDGTCGNADGATCENPVQIADPTLVNVESNTASIVEWMHHLLVEQEFDIRFIAMDNEPELWGYTHYDVHPSCTTYEEILTKYLEYANAVRDLAPDAEITGPVTCCWYYYWNSAAGAADKGQYGNQDFLPWFLDSVQKHDQEKGIRTLDVLDIHYYPEGLYNENIDPETSAHRLRSTRSLWDNTYVDESWIGEPVYLIPRMKQLIDEHYPGTRLAISEWNWGAESTMNGALAIADVLGIYGREDVYFAAYWTFPPPDSPGYNAFKMYTNFDGQGARFGDLSVLSRSSDSDLVSSFAALDQETGELHLILIQKQPADDMEIEIQLNGFSPQPAARHYRYDQENPQGIVGSEIEGVNETFRLNLTPYSINLFVFSPQIEQ